MGLSLSIHFFSFSHFSRFCMKVELWRYTWWVSSDFIFCLLHAVSSNYKCWLFLEYEFFFFSLSLSLSLSVFFPFTCISFCCAVKIEWIVQWLWLNREGRSKVGVVASSCQWHQLLVPVRVHFPRKKHPLIFVLTLHLLHNMKMFQPVLISSWLLWRSSILLWGLSSCKLFFSPSLNLMPSHKPIIKSWCLV